LKQLYLKKVTKTNDSNLREGIDRGAGEERLQSTRPNQGM
jgi:hypothetical protein